VLQRHLGKGGIVLAATHSALDIVGARNLRMGAA
jgi:ABC-type transport system involved in cytochrome c biogenesis ATPase subunit